MTVAESMGAVDEPRCLLEGRRVLAPELCRGCHDSVAARQRNARRRNRACRRGPAQRAHELFEPGRLGDRQAARLWRRDCKGVGDVSRTIHERPGRCLDDPAPNPEGQFALDDIEALIFSVMNVHRRPAALQSQMLNHRHAPGGLFTAGFDDSQSAEELKSLSFSLFQGHRVHSWFCRGSHSSSRLLQVPSENRMLQLIAIACPIQLEVIS